MIHQAKLKKEHLTLVLSSAAMAAEALEASNKLELAKKIRKAIKKTAEAFRLTCDCPKCQAGEKRNTH